MSLGQSPTNDSCTLHLADAEATKRAGESLAKSLYTLPLTILLRGPVGAGKTTFIQGFAEGLGIVGSVLSPTFALEQRYKIRLGELLHMDLYRLTSKEAKEMMHRTHDHEGIRIVEWADRSPAPLDDSPRIELTFSEQGSGRMLECIFLDLSIPDDARIDEWRRDAALPPYIVAHCDAVGSFAKSLTNKLHAKGILARSSAVRAAGKCHDLLRFVDFRGNAGPKDITVAKSPLWDEWKSRFPGLRHEAAMAEFLRQQGFAGVAEIVRTHGLWLPPAEDARTEQLLLYYADKRLKVDEVVSLEERFRDLRERYGDEQSKMETDVWFPQAKRIEAMLFPEGAP